MENIIVPLKYAQRLDTLLWDTEDSEYKVLKCNTYNSSAFDSTRYERLNVIYYADPTQVRVLSNTASSYTWALNAEWKLTPDPNGGSFTIKYTPNTGTVTTEEITYNAGDSLTTIAASVRAAILSAPKTSSLLYPGNLTVQPCYNIADSIVITNLGNYYFYGLSLTNTTGNATLEMLTEVDFLTASITRYGLRFHSATLVRNNMAKSDFAGIAATVFSNYYKKSGSTGSNTPISSTTILKLEELLKIVDGTYANPALILEYGVYTDGVLDLDKTWTKYITSHMTKFPFPRTASIFDEGEKNSNILGNVTFVSLIDGSTKYAYPAIHYCTLFSTLRISNWICPSLFDLYWIYKDTTTVKDDTIMTEMKKISSADTLLDYHWTSSECSSSGTFCFNTTYGGFHYNNKCNSYRTRSVSVIPIY